MSLRAATCHRLVQFAIRVSFKGKQTSPLISPCTGHKAPRSSRWRPGFGADGIAGLDLGFPTRFAFKPLVAGLDWDV